MRIVYRLVMACGCCHQKIWCFTLLRICLLMAICPADCVTCGILTSYAANLSLKMRILY